MRFTADLKNPKKNFFDVFFSAQYDFCALQLPFLMQQHLVHPIGRLSCDFECLWCGTVKFRSVLVRTWKPQKPRFCVFWPKYVFFRIKLPFSFLVYLIHSSGQQSCYSEPYWSDIWKLRSVFLEISGKPWKTSLFDIFFGPEGNSLQSNVPFPLFAYILQ